jgi:hypothetical protein
MGLNCVIDWEKEKRIDDDLRDGRYIFVGKSIPTARYVGTVSDFLSEKKEKEPLVTEDDLNWNSVILAREVGKAIEKAKMLGSEKVDVKKTRQKKQNADEIVHLALQGKSAEVLRRLVDASIRR